MRALGRSSILVVLLLFGATAEGATIFVANLTTSQEPALNGPTTATGAPRPIPFGNATFTLNDAMDALFMTVTVFNIDVTGSQTADVNDNLTAAHIHAGAVAAPAFGVVWDSSALRSITTIRRIR